MKLKITFILMAVMLTSCEFSPNFFETLSSSSDNATSNCSTSIITSATTNSSFGKTSVATSYTVTWINWDGCILETDTNVQYGSFPSYNGITPQREDDGQYSYVFDGWSPNLVSVTSNVTYTAKFITADRYLNVRWVNWDGTLLDTDSVKYGEKPVYHGSIPRREDSSYIYTFIGWDPGVVNIYDNTTYTAQFSSSTRYECDNVYHWIGNGKKESHDYTYSNEVFKCSICGHTVRQVFSCNSAIDATTNKNYFQNFTGYIEGTKDFIIPKYYRSYTVCDVRELSKYLGDVENLWLPSSITNVELSGLSKLKQINFENTSIKTMPYLSGKNALKQITFPKTLSEYPITEYYSSIDSCSSLTAIYVDDNNQKFSSLNGILCSKDKTTIYRVPTAKTDFFFDSSVTTIASYAFSYCKMTSIFFTNSLKSIGDYAFYSCKSLKEVDAASALSMSWGKSLFKDCTNLEIITFPDFNGDETRFNQLTSDDSLLTGCNNIKIINNLRNNLWSVFTKGYFLASGFDEYYKHNSDVPNTLTTIRYIGKTVWTGGISGTNANTIVLSPNTVELKEYAFDHSYKLTTIDFNGAPIQKLPMYCFRNCSSLTQFTVPETVTYISRNCFEKCSKLASLTIPSSVKIIGSSCFLNCSSLTDIYYLGTLEQWNQIYFESHNYNVKVNVHCSDCVLTEYLI